MRLMRLFITVNLFVGYDSLSLGYDVVAMVEHFYLLFKYYKFAVAFSFFDIGLPVHSDVLLKYIHLELCPNWEPNLAGL